jgi:hypothetical protein
MRSMILSSAAVVFTTAILALPAQAALHHRNHANHLAYAGLAGSGGFGTGPYSQGTSTGHRPIWRNGYYQGTDPDVGIRFDLIRDGRNYAH